jgi:hypothetical protein
VPNLRALNPFWRASKLPWCGEGDDVSRLLGASLPTLVWIGTNLAGVGTVLVPPATVISVLVVTVRVAVNVGAWVVEVVRIVVVSVKVFCSMLC